MDKKFTEKMQAWLMKPEHDVDHIREGAEMVLQLTRNRYFYNQIMQRPLKMASTVEYELKKHLKYRLQNMTLDDVKVMEKQILSDVTPFVAPEPEHKEDELPQSTTDKVMYRGKRPDHDTLPADVQQLWTENAERYKRIKQLYNTCMEQEQACDRYEYAQQLQEAWRTYHAVMQDYDNYVIKPNVDTLPPAEDMETKYKNARSYISKNIAKLESLDKDSEEAKVLAAKLKERVELLVNGKQVIGDELAARLVKLELLFVPTTLTALTSPNTPTGGTENSEGGKSDDGDTNNLNAEADVEGAED